MNIAYNQEYLVSACRMAFKWGNTVKAVLGPWYKWALSQYDFDVESWVHVKAKQQNLIIKPRNTLTY